VTGATRKIIADLHTHSTASDGECSPSEVVRFAKAKRFKAVALTDHDTLSGLEEASKAAKDLEITLVPGIEVSVSYKRPWFTGSLHVLVYFLQEYITNPDFVREIRDILAEGRGYKLLSNRIIAINMLFGPQGSIKRVLKHELEAGEIGGPVETVTQRNFALALKKHHDLDDVTISSIIANTSPAYIPYGIKLACLKPLLNKYHIVKVLAHPAAGTFPGPGQYREVLPPFETVVQLLPECIDLGIDGLEVYYPGHTSALIDKLRSLSDNNKLLVTGGSDFHDVTTRPMGTAGVTEEELDTLLQTIAINK
jgi:predicted metal-dependent phosphoesterase TrpH